MDHVYLQTIKTQRLDELPGDGSETHGEHFLQTVRGPLKLRGKSLVAPFGS